MSFTINTNMFSLDAQRNLATNQSSLSTAMQRLSSGLKINSAVDDPAGIEISNTFTSQINGLTQASSNANNAISMVQTIQGGLSTVSNMLQRMRELAVQAADDSNTSGVNSNRSALNAEFTSLSAEIDRVATSTTFNGQHVLNGSFGSTATAGAGLDPTTGISAVASEGAAAGSYTLTVSGTQLTLANGTNSQTIDIGTIPSGLNTKDVTFGSGVKITVNSALADTTTGTITVAAGSGTFQIGADNAGNNELTLNGVDAQASTLGISTLSVDTLSNAQAAISGLDGAINQVNASEGNIGAVNARLNYTVSNLSSMIQNMTAARSRVTDADFAAETANMTKGMILQQAGISVLAQANSMPQQILKLLQ